MMRLRVLFICVVLSLVFGGHLEGQTPSQIPVALPINGYFLLGLDNRLLMFDTYNGGVQVITEQQAPRPIDVPLLNRQGTDVVYRDPLDLQVWRDFLGANSTLMTFPYDPQIGIFDPQDWSSDAGSVLGIVAAGAIGGYEVQVLNPQNGSFTTLRRYEIDEPLSEAPTLEFFSIQRASWNPVQPEWIALQLATFPAGSEDTTGEGRFSVTVNLVFNHSTGETLLLNDFLPNPIFSGTSPIWSPDGQYLLTETVDSGGMLRLHVIEFRNMGSGWTFDVVKSGVKEISSIQHWLGVGDLLLDQSVDSSKFEMTYYVAQVIDGEMLRREFFRVLLSSFSDYPLGRVLRGSWHLTASDEEKHALSCLFDQALPTRLSIGTRARVSITDSIALRAEPSFDAAAITQMQEGTEFDVIGGPACVNSDLYYRLWQIELDDGTIGWVAEANNIEYFIEPVIH